MNEFSAIRAKAKERHDRLVVEAREQYERTLSQIANLENDLTGRTRLRKSIVASIEAVIPDDQEFSVDDLMLSLQQMDDTRVWSKPKVWNHIAKLRRKGQIKRTRRHSYNEPALYVRTGVEAPERPFATTPLNDVVALVLADKQMTELELTVAVLEAGYESKRSRRKLMEAIGQILRKDERFKMDGGKWALITNSRPL